MGAYDKLFKRYVRSQGWYCAPPPDEGTDDGDPDDDPLDHLQDELDDDDRKVLGLDNSTSDADDKPSAGDEDKDKSDSDVGDDFDYKAGYTQVKAELDGMKAGRSADGPESGKEDTTDGGKDTTGPVKSGDLKVQDVPDDNPLSKYNGMLFKDVYTASPEDAYALSSHHAHQHALDLRDVQNAEAAKKKEYDDWVKGELDNFESARASELFDSKDYGSLTTAQKTEISGIKDKVLAWMDKTGRGGASIEDAYFLMNKDDIISRARSSGAKALAKDAASGKVVRVNAGGGGDSDVSGKVDGTWKSLIGASAADVEEHLMGLDETAFSKMMKEAPKEFRDKYPYLPYG